MVEARSFFGGVVLFTDWLKIHDDMFTCLVIDAARRGRGKIMI